MIRTISTAAFAPGDKAAYSCRGNPYTTPHHACPVVFARCRCCKMAGRKMAGRNRTRKKKDMGKKERRNRTRERKDMRKRKEKKERKQERQKVKRNRNPTREKEEVERKKQGKAEGERQEEKEKGTHREQQIRHVHAHKDGGAEEGDVHHVHRTSCGVRHGKGKEGGREGGAKDACAPTRTPTRADANGAQRQKKKQTKKGGFWARKPQEGARARDTEIVDHMMHHVLPVVRAALLEAQEEHLCGRTWGQQVGGTEACRAVVEGGVGRGSNGGLDEGAWAASRAGGEVNSIPTHGFTLPVVIIVFAWADGGGDKTEEGQEKRPLFGRKRYSAVIRCAAAPIASRQYHVQRWRGEVKLRWHGSGNQQEDGKNKHSSSSLGGVQRHPGRQLGATQRQSSTTQRQSSATQR
ncbi:hypothetical protein C8F04DRAFT_1182008 [Mycena alexandri]|uniref:Uncharacterized protein n=1 Tax=Mycena alexandri TaxID=1745969 RepID=A0AAD6X506_9AGAR|nr:hypothetical protein C8F04DRAFT_1182008 [Mycena alexandri]